MKRIHDNVRTIRTLLAALALGASGAWAQQEVGEPAQPEQPAAEQPDAEQPDNGPGEAPLDAAEAAEGQPEPALDPGELVTRVVSVKRNALWRASEEDAWQPVEADQILPLGAELRTSVGSEVVLSVGPNAELTIGPLSRFTVGRLERDDQTIRTRVTMPMGNVKYQVKEVGFENDLAITTPTGTMAVKGTTGTIEQYDETDIDNDEGSVTFLNTYGHSNNIDGDNNLDGDGDGDGEGSGAGGNNTENDNRGDGNGNGTGNLLPNRDPLDGNQSRRNTQKQFEKDLREGDDGGNF